MLRARVWCWLSLVGLVSWSGCSCGGLTAVDGGGTDSGIDGGAIDAGRDSGAIDAPADVPAMDDTGGDSGGDAGADAGDDAGDDAGTGDAGTCCDRLGTEGEIAWLAGADLLPDVACPPWTLADSADEDAMLADGALVIETTTDSESISYDHRVDDLTPGSTVVIEARMRVLSGSSSTPSRAATLIAGTFGGQKTMLQIGTTEIFLNSAENTRGDAADLDTSVLHDYRIEIDLTTDQVRVLVDGVETVTGTTFADPSGAEEYLVWGEGSLFAHGRSEWVSVRHDAYGGCAPP